MISGPLRSILPVVSQIMNLPRGRSLDCPCRLLERIRCRRRKRPYSRISRTWIRLKLWLRDCACPPSPVRWWIRPLVLRKKTLSQPRPEFQSGAVFATFPTMRGDDNDDQVHESRPLIDLWLSRYASDLCPGRRPYLVC